jgi:DNA-binding XRE family transcriptional regulator
VFVAVWIVPPLMSMSAVDGLRREIQEARGALASGDREPARQLLTAVIQHLARGDRAELPRRVDAIEVGVVLRLLRREQQLSIKTLAFDAGMSPSYLSEIERGQRNSSLEKLADLAIVLDQPLSEIMRDAEARRWSR